MIRKKAGRKAFSMVEMLIAVIIAAILGGAALVALMLTFGMFGQLSDYIGGRSEIQTVALELGVELTNVGLGMPNNRRQRGSFAEAFSPPPGTPPANESIMAKMGALGEDWGGPITLSEKNSANEYDVIPMVMTREASVDVDGQTRSMYAGPELYYARGLPTRVKASIAGAENEGFRQENQGKSRSQEGPGTSLFLQIPASEMNMLDQFDLVTRNAQDPRSWVLFPTARLPMLITDITSNGLSVDIAPNSSVELTAPLMGFDEIYLPEVSRVYLDEANEQVVRVDFAYDRNTNTLKPRTDILARNIIGLYFLYDPDLRILSMYIAARGTERTSENYSESVMPWPAGAGTLPEDRRLVVQRIDWRIRN